MTTNKATTTEVGAHLGKMYRAGGKPFTRQTVTRWRIKERMPHYKIANAVSFDLAQVEQWADRRWRKGA
jgi:hypothetical protein